MQLKPQRMSSFAERSWDVGAHFPGSTVADSRPHVVHTLEALVLQSHYEIVKHYQGTSKCQPKVQQNLTVQSERHEKA